jgi:type II secretory pathway predicted ATPase ExeA/LysM repeat protein
MYYRHFGLDGPAFGFVPSARGLYLSQPHREALAALEWGVLHEPSGFTLLIGETGAGKTTLVKSILARHYARVRTACVNNPKRGFEGILREIMPQLSLDTSSSKLEMLSAFDRFIEHLRPSERIVILVDEAQTLDDDSLEELRLFSNSGGREEKQLHFILVGQPELIRRLMQPSLRQLNDRIAARALLNPLSRDEACAYVDFRLKARGGRSSQIFEPAALDHLITHSAGIPRRLNVLGHNAMLLAYSAGARQVTLKSAHTAVMEYENLLSNANGLTNIAPTSRSRWRSLGLVGAALGAALGGIVAIIAAGANRATVTGATFAGDVSVNPRTPAVTKIFAPVVNDIKQVKAPAANAGDIQGARGSSTGPAKPVTLAAAEVSTAAGTPPRRRIQVRRGDTLRLLAARYLGSEEQLKRLIDANPQLRNFDLIYPGQTVYLPTAPAAKE